MDFSIENKFVKEYIKKDTENNHFKFLLNLYKEMLGDIQKHNNENYRYTKEFKVRSFSDNILFAASTNVDIKWQLSYTLGDIIHIASKIQSLALMNGFLVRGGITVGDIFIDNNFVYGKGLLDVLNLEEKVAHYPRIVVDKSVENECPEYFKSGYNIITDQDGLKFIDFYNCSIDDDYKLDACAKQLEKMKQSFCTSYNVMSKLNWSILQYNSFLKRRYPNQEIKDLISPATTLVKFKD